MTELATCTRWILWWVAISLFSLVASVDAQPCARFYMHGLDTTTTAYPQLAGVYKLQTSPVSHWVSVIGANLQYSFYIFGKLLLEMLK